jgi:hypothetical protein
MIRQENNKADVPITLALNVYTVCSKHNLSRSCQTDACDRDPFACATCVWPPFRITNKNLLETIAPRNVDKIGLTIWSTTS